MITVAVGTKLNGDEIMAERNLFYEQLERQSDGDYVEVVRCKDCKHCFVDGTNVRYNVCELNHNKVQGDNWFCADGKRKTDNT